MKKIVILLLMNLVVLNSIFSMKDEEAFFIAEEVESIVIWDNLYLLAYKFQTYSNFKVELKNKIESFVKDVSAQVTINSMRDFPAKVLAQIRGIFNSELSNERWLKIIYLAKVVRLPSNLIKPMFLRINIDERNIEVIRLCKDELSYVLKTQERTRIFYEKILRDCSLFDEYKKVKDGNFSGHSQNFERFVLREFKEWVRGRNTENLLDGCILTIDAWNDVIKILYIYLKYFDDFR